MKTVLIIGNGLDLNLGRNTSYSEFWKSPYCPKNYPAPLIYHLNQKWSEDNEAVKWYDLENELLNYVRIIKKKVADGIPYDIVTSDEQRILKRHEILDGDNTINYDQNDVDVIKSLAEKGFIDYNIFDGYIKTTRDDYDEFQLSAVERDKKALQWIKLGLCHFLKTITDSGNIGSTVAMATLRAVQERKEDCDDVSVYTFNYTALPRHYEDVLKPQYIHGSCSEGSIIIGTKDSEELGHDYDFLQKSFDKHFQTPPIVYDLLYADEIVFFGHSLGMNDSQYLKSFFQQQTNTVNPKSKNITIFTKDDKSELEIKRALQEMTEYNLSLLNSLNSFKIIKTKGITTNWKDYKMFLSRFVDNPRLVESLLHGLKE